MAVNIYNNSINGCYIGNSAITAIYQGTELLYTTTPPIFEGKWLAKYYNGSTSAECDSTSAITSGEINKTNLIDVKFGSCVTTIGDYVFDNCRTLRSINIPSGITSIGKQAFVYCTRVSSITFDEGSQLTSIGNEAFWGCSGITSIDIPSGVTSFDWGTFGNCTSLTSCTIGNGVTNLGDSTFRNCRALRRLNSNIDGVANLPSGITNIGEETFASCYNLSTINIPSGVTSIGYGAFGNCTSLQSIEIPSEVTSIGGWAFNNCTSLTSIEIPSEVTSIGNYAFTQCTNLTSIIVDSNNSTFDSRNNCNAIIKTSNNELVIGCNYSVIPDSVTSIGASAFYQCNSLTSVTIPNSVTSIGNYTFDYCTSLTSITCLATTPPTLGSNVFDMTNDCPIYVPSGSLSAYQSAWSAYASRIQAIP